jgi:penicillin-binding protein 1C
MVMAFAWLLLPKPPLLDGVPFSQVVRDRNGRVLRVTLTPDGKFRVRTPLERVSPHMIEATLLYEDRHFMSHPGVNPIALARAGWRYCAGRKRGGGASTVTMQVARLRFGLNTRSIHGKLGQVLRALELERHYTKAEIIEAYLNLAPYGRNIEGVGAASMIYWGKEAEAVTRPEAVALSVIPQSPTRRALRAADRAAGLAGAQTRLADKLAAHAGARADLAEFVPLTNRKPPFLAPHFTRAVLQENRSVRDLTTTLDLDLQRMIERTISRYVAARGAAGIHNAAVLLVDARTMEVLAHAGSADFFDTRISGQVDGARSPRSPGSTLKPFVYALAMEQGLIHPLTMLKDAPHSFGGYGPENFDREFEGPIKARDALARSRNIPAVWLASELRRPGLYQFIKNAGVDLPREESHYGLALPLGGAELTMEDLVRLYAMLANGGRMRELRRTLRSSELQALTPNASHPDRSGASTSSETKSRFCVEFLRPETAFLTLDMLRDEKAGSCGVNALSWKTGTSHGFRDAWSVGVFDSWVLAVWVGNFDGTGNNAFVGRTAAAPLFFQIIEGVRALHPPCPASSEPAPGLNLRRVEFCADSGQIPTTACPHRVSGWFIPGVSPISECAVHREIFVDRQSGLRVAHERVDGRTRREVFEFWPADLLALFQQAGLPRRVPPPFLPGEGVEIVNRVGDAPEIVSPKAGVRYRLGAGGSSGSTLMLSARTDSDVQRVFWFAGQEFIGSARPDEACQWEPKGTASVRVIVMDDHGRSSARNLEFFH